MKFTTFILGLLLLPVCVFADNRQDAKMIREMVWAWDNPEFKNYQVPAGYENESAVILVRHQHLEATSKNRFRMNFMLFGDVNRELYYTYIDRRMVKINDLSALKSFAELTFRDETKTMGYLRSNKLKTIVGARVIKPDGQIQEVNVDDEAVSVTEGKKEKDALRKLAISGLQVGDVLDYFFCDQMELETYNIPPEVFTFYSSYATLKYSVHCEFGNKLTVEYRSINGAPEMKSTVDAEGNYVLDAEAQNLMKVPAYEDIRWASVYRSFPMIRMYVLNNASKLIYKSANARQSGVFANLPYEEYLNDSKALLAAQEKEMIWMTDIDKNVKKTVTAYMAGHPSLDFEQMAVLLYDALRFHWPDNYNYYPRDKFVVKLQKLLREYHVPHQLLFATSRFGVRKDDVVSDDDIIPGLLANGKQVFFFNNGYRYAGEVSPIFQGETAATVEVVKYAMKKNYGIVGAIGEYVMPVSTAHDNLLASQMDVKLCGDGLQELTVKRKLKCTGSMKDDYWQLLLYEDWDSEMRKALGIEKTLIEELKEDKSTRKRIDEYMSIRENRKKSQEEAVQAELTAYHEQEPKSVLGYSFAGIGVTPGNPVLEYEVSYTLDGLVKRAGKNLILDIGKLIGTQWQPNELDENRQVDAYLPTAMHLNFEIAMEIPQGYTVEGLDALSFEYTNDYGGFHATGKKEGNKLLVSVNKIYTHAYVPVAGWKEMLLIAKKANDFQGRSVVLSPL